MQSTLTYSQKQTKKKTFIENGKTKTIVVEIRYDDSCRNGHNSFAITGIIYRGTALTDRNVYCGGYIHDEIVKHFPELAKYIKWHLMSTDGPMHYVANTLYWASEGNLDYARNAAVWPNASDRILLSKKLDKHLERRLPALMNRFREAVEELGFVY